MLPDFPSLKTKLRARLRDFVDHRTEEYMGLLGRIPKHQLHEGRGQILARQDGSVDDSESAQVAVPIFFEGAEVNTLTMDQLLAKLDRAAWEMAQKQSAIFGEKFERTTREVGNAIDATGMNAVQAYFAMLDRIDLHFNSDGSPQFPEIPQSSGTAWLQSVRSQIKADPELTRRFTDLIARKKEEFRDRESSRKLVG